jgi:hypothetical protein
METKISVNIAIMAGKVPLCALADVTLRWGQEELTIRRCAVFQKIGGPRWATLPRLTIHKNGMKSYVPLIDLSRDTKQRVLEAVLAEYEKKRDAR